MKQRLYSLAAALAGVGGLYVYLLPGSQAKPQAFGILLVVVALFTLAVVIWLDEQLGLAGAWHTLRTNKRRGIRRIYSDGMLGAEIGKSRVARSTDIRMMHTSGAMMIRSLRDYLLTALKQPGTEIRVLVARPDSEFLRDVESIEGPKRATHISAEVHATADLLREIVDEASETTADPRKRGRVWLGYYGTHLRSSLLLCDKEWGWVTLVLPPRRAVESVSLEVVAERPSSRNERSGPGESTQHERSLIEDCLQHFDKVWAASDPHEIVAES